MYRTSTVVKFAVALLLAALVYKLGLVELVGTHLVQQPPPSLARTQLSPQEDSKHRENQTKKQSYRGAMTESGVERGLIGTAGEKKSKPGLEVVYTSLENCEKPTYDPRYKALCMSANSGRDSEELLKCLPNHYLLGIRKCGTTDIIKWFQYHTPNTTVTVKGDRIINQCPMEYFKRRLKHNHPQNFDLMNYSPGEILFSHIKKKNTTHLVIGSTIQYIAYISDPARTKYILTLRNPTDRLVSYLFHAHNQRWIHRTISFEDFNGVFVHQIVVELISKVEKCLEKYGEVACIHLYSSYDGSLDTVIQHGFYVVYVQELFRFIPRESVYINQLEEYSSNQLTEATKFMKFFGYKLNVTDAQILLSSEKKMNSGHKTAVLPETTQLLNDLYRPYNIRLAKLLGNERWNYS